MPNLDLLDHDALLATSYHIEIDGMNIASFKEVSGISIEQTLVELKVSAGKGEVATRKYPGAVKYGDITLKRGQADKDDLYKWIHSVEEHKYEESLRNGSIVQFAMGAEANRWNFEKAWPSKWELSAQKSDGNEIIVESITIKVDRLWKD